MLGSKQNKVILLIAAVFLISLFFNFKLDAKTKSLSKDLERQRQVRLSLQGKVNALTTEKDALLKEKNTLEETRKSLESALDEERVSLKATQDSVQNLEDINKDLETKLEQVKRLQVSFEDELKELLLNCKPKKKK